MLKVVTPPRRGHITSIEIRATVGGLTVREVLTEEDKRAFRERINQIEEVALQVREAAALARLSPAE
jgi:hypothetical protein